MIIESGVAYISSRSLFKLKTFLMYKYVTLSVKFANTSTVTQVSGGITMLNFDQTFWSVAQNLNFLSLHWFQQWSILFKFLSLKGVTFFVNKSWSYRAHLVYRFSPSCQTPKMFILHIFDQSRYSRLNFLKLVRSHLWSNTGLRVVVWKVLEWMGADSMTFSDFPSSETCPPTWSAMSEYSTYTKGLLIR